MHYTTIFSGVTLGVNYVLGEKKKQKFGHLHQFPLVQLVGSCSASTCQHTAFNKPRITEEEKHS